MFQPGSSSSIIFDMFDVVTHYWLKSQILKILRSLFVHCSVTSQVAVSKDTLSYNVWGIFQHDPSNIAKVIWSQHTVYITYIATSSIYGANWGLFRTFSANRPSLQMASTSSLAPLHLNASVLVSHRIHGTGNIYLHLLDFVW